MCRNPPDDLPNRKHFEDHLDRAVGGYVKPLRPGQESDHAPTLRPKRMRSSVLAILAGLLMVVAGCGGGQESSSGVQPPGGTAQSPSGGGARVEGLFEVGDHHLFLECDGTGSPTVVYLHGSIEDPNAVPRHAGDRLQELLASDYRTCVYDRRNVGESDTVDKIQSPEDALNDLHGLLDAAEIEPPYVLVGASFGGILAYLYENEHRDQVVGMVLLDAMFPNELALEHLFPPKDRYRAPQPVG